MSLHSNFNWPCKTLLLIRSIQKMCAEDVLQNPHWESIFFFFFMLFSKLKCNHQIHIEVELRDLILILNNREIH